MSYLSARPAGAARMQGLVDSLDPAEWTDAHALVEAEVVTGEELARLGPLWSVLHSVPVGPDSAILPHLVIGPHGAFALSSRFRPRTVVEIVDGVSALCPQVSDSDISDSRELAQQVRARLLERFGRAVDIPAVHPLICLVDVPDGSSSDGGRSTDVVPVQRLVEHLRRYPRRLTPVWVERLAQAAADPSTWNAPTCECFAPDLTARYAALVQCCRQVRRKPSAAALPDRVVQGEVLRSDWAEPSAPSRALHVMSVLVLLLGLVSLATLGGAAPPTLALGGLTLRHYGGWQRLSNKEYLLMALGMGTAALSLVPGVFVWPYFLLNQW